MTARLNTLKDEPQERILTGMLKEIRRFAGGAEQFDDITMLGITYLQTQAGTDSPAASFDSRYS